MQKFHPLEAPHVASNCTLLPASSAWMITEVECRYVWLALNITNKAVGHHLVLTFFLYKDACLANTAPWLKTLGSCLTLGIPVYYLASWPKGVVFSCSFLPFLQKVLCRSMHNEGYCVPQSLQQSAGSCSAEGLWNQCGGNDLCFVRGPEEESLEKWCVHCPHLH